MQKGSRGAAARVPSAINFGTLAVDEPAQMNDKPASSRFPAQQNSKSSPFRPSAPSPSPSPVYADDDPVVLLPVHASSSDTSSHGDGSSNASSRTGSKELESLDFSEIELEDAVQVYDYDVAELRSRCITQTPRDVHSCHARGRHPPPCHSAAITICP